MTILICLGIFVGSLFLMKGVGTEFIPTQDNARIGVNLELPIGSRVEYAEEVTARLDSLWRNKYPEIKVSNYTVGPASSDNTFASLSDNGAHIISMNISLTSSTERDRGIVEIANEMRKDIDTMFPDFKKAQVMVGGGMSGGMFTATEGGVMASRKPTAWPATSSRFSPA